MTGLIANYNSLIMNLNNRWHELALRLYTVIVLGHWAEHLTQAFQIYVLEMPREKSLGVLGVWYPWLIKSEALHYGYAVIMLIGFWILRSGFQGRSLRWWKIALVIQFWHHFEHLLLQLQYLFGYNLFNSPVPVSLVQLWIPRVELHLFYNAIVFAPMVVAMYYHLLPNAHERQHMKCTCALQAA